MGMPKGFGLVGVEAEAGAAGQQGHREHQESHQLYESQVYASGTSSHRLRPAEAAKGGGVEGEGEEK